MEKMLKQFYAVDCRVFRNVNQLFVQKYLNIFFRNITHLGGATFTISAILLMLIIGSPTIRIIALASALALVVGQIPVLILKKLYPRRRPYIVLEKIYVTERPLKDHSFPSGHTTAIFSVIVPFVLYNPVLAIFFLPLAIIVGISRTYLGLHFPSDVVAGMILGSTTGFVAYTIIEAIFPYVLS